MDSVDKVQRDTAFDDVPSYRSAGIRLVYTGVTEPMEGLRDGVLLEAGFDKVAPNTPKDISSWLYDRAVASKVDVIDNRANAVPCYDPGFTFVEKLQTISTKFRKQQADGSDPVAFMRRYYDVYKLLQRPEVQAFIGAEAYKEHKKNRFRQGDNPVSLKIKLSSCTTLKYGPSTPTPSSAAARFTTPTNRASPKY